MKHLLLTFLLLSTTTFAASLSTIKAQMKARAGEIATLKASGHLGEDAKGLLSVRTATPAATATAQAENADRKLVYRALAAKAGGSADAVGQRAAARYAERSPAGTWLQAVDGTWSQKE
ncbi:MAG TPA: DUF1318 domain-containing protein [Lentisphaeria bacterium]|jgi:uncharacterized protein YdbL (DUF1318 family)|nr:DUF1318 domain-containing protein [Lentisphaeria bacterium]